MSRPPSTPDRPTASTPTSRSAGDQLAVDHAAQDGRGHLEGGRVGHPQAALEAAGHAQSLEPLRDPLAATVDEHDRPPPGDRGDLDEDLLLVGDRRAAQLDDEDLAHRVRLTSCTPRSRSRTASVRSQPNASPLPGPRPRSSRMRISGAAIVARVAARSNASGPPAAPSKTSWPAIAIRSRAGSSVTGRPARAAASVSVRPAASRTAASAARRVARRRRDPAPVRVARRGRPP